MPCGILAGTLEFGALQALGSNRKSFGRLSAPPLTGLYDNQGVLRFAGRDHADCLAYVELFGLDLVGCSITLLGSTATDAPGSAETATLFALG